MAESKRPLGALIGDQFLQQFCGRQHELERFSSLLAQAKESTHVWAIHGIGGVGKSILVKKFVRISRESDHLVALVEGDRTSSPIGILRALADQLSTTRKLARRFRAFSDASAKLDSYSVKASDQYHGGEHGTLEDMAAEAIKGGLSGSLGALAGALIAGPAGAIAGGLAGGALAPLVDRTRESIQNLADTESIDTDDLALFARPVETLSSLFSSCINSISPTKSPIVLIFDAFEYLGGIEEWLRDSLLGSLNEEGFIVIVSGRDPLDPKDWLTWRTRLTESKLEVFTEQEARRFLQVHQIYQEDFQNRLIRLSAKLPLALALSVHMISPAARLSAGEEEIDELDLVSVIGIVVETFLRDQRNPELSQIIYAASIPRWANYELLHEMLDGVLTTENYRHLLRIASIIRRHQLGISLHDVVRQYLSKSLSVNQPARYERFHSKARDYFAAQKTSLESAGEIFAEAWQTYSLEWVYHSMILGELHILEQEVDRSSRYYQHAYAQRLLTDVSTYVKDIEELSHTIAYHRAQNAIHHNDFIGAIALLSPLTSLTPTDSFRTRVNYQLGKAYFWLGDFRKSLILLKDALSEFTYLNETMLASHNQKYMAMLYEAIGDVQRAKAYRRASARSILQLIDENPGSSTMDRELADRLFHIGEFHRLDSRILLAIRVHNLCIERRARLNNAFDLGESYIALAKCLTANQAFDEAKEALDRSSQIFNSTKDEYMLADIYFLRGQIETGFDQKKATGYLRQAIALASNSQHKYCQFRASVVLWQILCKDHTSQSRTIMELSQRLQPNVNTNNYSDGNALFFLGWAYLCWNERKVVLTSKYLKRAFDEALQFNSMLLDRILDDFYAHAKQDPERLQHVLIQLHTNLQSDEHFDVKETDLRERDGRQNQDMALRIELLMRSFGKPSGAD